MDLPLQSGMWRDEPAFLIGGGPSLRGFPWEALKSCKNIVAVNRAWIDVPWASIWFSEDFETICRVWGTLPEWKAFLGIKVLHVLTDKYKELVQQVDKSVHFLDSSWNGKKWASSFSEGFSYSSNSMVGALNLVHILGANPIYLLGVDCKSRTGLESNYHQDYEKCGKHRANADRYLSFKSDFENWAAWHLRDRNVYNLNPDSAVECWPKLEWRKVIPYRDSVQRTVGV